MKTDNSEGFRQSRIEHIQHKQSQRVEKLRQLGREMKELEDAETALHLQMMRAQRFDTGLGICPRCAIDEGITSKLIAIPIAAIARDDISEDVDLMQCPRCGWDDTVTA